MSRLTIFILCTTILISACGTKDIDNIERQHLPFDSLPEKVKTIYQNHLQKVDTIFEYHVITTDNSVDFKHEHTGMDNGILNLVTRGFNHHFYINGQHFKLQANKGDPFILHEKHLYYTLELNLADYNYKSAQYVSVNLEDYLK
ncbi:MAG: hypothetical protein MUE96_00455 [Bacteroidia bacterium]|jgi:hypothetical protein|nr:hypothetical protein [Bacteroidia bacterium]